MQAMSDECLSTTTVSACNNFDVGGVSDDAIVCLPLQFKPQYLW
jgi:hypothetical protein